MLWEQVNTTWAPARWGLRGLAGVCGCWGLSGGSSAATQKPVGCFWQVDCIFCPSFPHCRAGNYCLVWGWMGHPTPCLNSHALCRGWGSQLPAEISKKGLEVAVFDQQLLTRWSQSQLPPEHKGCGTLMCGIQTSSGVGRPSVHTKNTETSQVSPVKSPSSC